MIPLNHGELLFLLGPNGSGKSGLINFLARQHQHIEHRISAHRQTWLNSNTTNITPQRFSDRTNSVRDDDIGLNARIRDQHADNRIEITKYRIIRNINLDSRNIVEAKNAGDTVLEQRLFKEFDNPIRKINEAFQNVGLSIEISLNEDDAFMATKGNSVSFGIDHLSDGERAAFLIAGDIFTADPGTLFLIDEPERHLHRSINSPLLATLLSKRPDCYFVVATHEIALPIDIPESKTLLIRDCTWGGSQAANWYADLVEDRNDIDDAVKKDLLGNRKNTVFVEGDDKSPDIALYGLIMPNVSVVHKQGRRDIITAVKGVTSSKQIHWVNAYSIVDNDGFDSSRISQYREEGIYSIDVHAIESLYYDVQIQKALAKKRSKVSASDANERLDKAKKRILRIASKAKTKLIEKATERRVQEKFKDNMPNKETHDFTEIIKIKIDAPSIWKHEKQIIEDAIKNQDVDLIIRRYPIKETGIPKEVSEILGFDDKEEYRDAALELLKENETMRKYVGDLLGGLPEQIAQNLP